MDQTLIRNSALPTFEKWVSRPWVWGAELEKRFRKAQRSKCKHRGIYICHQKQYSGKNFYQLNIWGWKYWYYVSACCCLSWEEAMYQQQWQNTHLY